ncbi:MAG: calcium/sodium antiporter [Treponemataceae bacterium]
MFGNFMNGIWVYVFLIVGFIFLIKGADIFVDGASSLAKLLKVPVIVIGLTIVAFGTSFPELAVSITSAIKGQNEICVGNVVGSNIFNTLTVLGFSAIFMPVIIQKNVIAKDLPFNFLCSVVLFVLSFDVILNFGSDSMIKNSVSRSDGIILLCFFSIYIFYVVYYAVSGRKNFEAQTQEALNSEESEKKMGFLKSILFTLLGGVGIVLGGDITVDAAGIIAIRWGMSETLVGLTIVAIGTSLPELITSIVAAKKGECDLAVGNVVGSNIFNLLFILGVSAVINPIELTDPNLLKDMLIMIVISFIIFFVCLPLKIKRPLGFLLIFVYAGYFLFIILR